MSNKIDLEGATMIEVEMPQFIKTSKEYSAIFIEKNKNDRDFINGSKIKVLNLNGSKRCFAFFVFNDAVYGRELLDFEVQIGRNNPSALTRIFSRQIDEIREAATA